MIALYVVEVSGYKLSTTSPLDVQVRVIDSQGNYRNDVTVDVLASNGAQSWSGTIAATGSNGYYQACNVGSFAGSPSGIVISATASKPGYTSGSGTGLGTLGNLTGCP